MKTRIPLSVKIGVWLALNLVLLVGVGLAVFGLKGGVTGWLARPIGDRLQPAGDAIAAQLRFTDAQDRDAMVSRFAAQYDLEFGVFLNDGEFVAGQVSDLPPEIVDRLLPTRKGGHGPGRQPPMRDGPDERQGPPPGGGPPRPRGDQPLPREDRPPPREDRPLRDQNAAGSRFFERGGDPLRWWAAVRIPISVEPGGPPQPGVLVAVSDSSLAFGTLLDVKPVIGAVGIALVVSILWWLPLVLGMTRALGKMMRTTESIAEGRFETRVGIARADEIGRLGQSIDQMAARLDSLVRGQRKFLGDVAHELGSPIGRLQMGTGILESRVPENLRPAVADVREDVQEMSVLVGELLAFTQAEMKPSGTSLESVSLRQVVERAIKREAGDRRVEVAVPDQLQAMADKALLTRAVANLVRNAVRYAGESATITVDVRLPSEGRIQLTVSDSGPGVPAEALSRLGEPFYRPDLARTREMGGVGLGLSIVRSAIKSMGGTVKFANASPHGFVVTIDLALA